MTFFSHSKSDSGGSTYGSKSLAIHINGVIAHVLHHYSSNCSLGYKNEELKELIQVIVTFHDLGKYTTYFQNYVLKRHPIDGLLKQHAKIGGLAAYRYLAKKDQKQRLLALYLIFQHHSYLIDVGQIGHRLNEDLQRIIEYQREDLMKNLGQIEHELGVSNLAELIEYPDERSIRKGFKQWTLRESSIRDYYLINYLFSLLIEADKLDASDTAPYPLKQMESSSVDKRFGTPDAFISTRSLQQLSNNELRNFCRSQVVANLDRKDILNHFTFTLTSPTGTGKTMTALDFALKLKAKIQVALGIEAQIIYALPFINIIEQATNEYRQTLPKEVKVLAHYQYADVFSKEFERPDDDEGESNYNQRLMALDTWQSDIVITSFVQFFETLIGNRNKLLKKFNHFANAIVILDEVQTLRLDQMPLIGATLFYLSKFLNTRIILMTATKPKVFELAQDHILQSEGETARPYELLPSFHEVFATFTRTKIVPLLGIQFKKDTLANEFIKDVFSKEWAPSKSCIIVCNTVKRSIEIHDQLTAWLQASGLSNKVEYLSTNIVPAVRFTRIQTLDNEIKAGRAPVLVSTQVVEAGVDLDFDMGFRDIGPIDSIVQVAGRVNRNNHINKTHSPVFIVDFGDAQKIYGRITYDQAKSALLTQREFKEADYLDLVSTYFDNISSRKSFSRFNKIFESMKMLRYDTEDWEEKRPISSFKIIEESRTTQAVFIELSEYEASLRKKYLAKIKGDISKQEFDKNYKLDFQQRIISIPSSLATDLPFINELDDNLKVVSYDSLTQYYCSETGFIRNRSDNAITFF